LKYYDTAIQSAEKTTEKWSYDIKADALNNKGNYYFELGRYDRCCYEKAIKFFEKALEYDQEHIRALNNMALTYIALEQYSDALDYSNRSMKNKSMKIDFKENPTIRATIRATVHDTRGVILYHQNDYDQALQYFDQASQIKPSYSYPLYHKGLVYIRKQKYNEAIQYFDRALSIDPRFAEAYNEKAVAYSLKKQYSDAKDELKKAVEIKPSLSISHDNLAQLSAALDPDGQPKKTISEFLGFLGFIFG
jgi:tetratricopeptide (TPR) repeat protein